MQWLHLRDRIEAPPVRHLVLDDGIGDIAAFTVLEASCSSPFTTGAACTPA